MFDALVERPSVAGDEDMHVVFATRPADPLALDEVDAEGNVERNLDAGADDLAVALDRVAISEVEKRPRRLDRQVNGHALDEAIVIHIATVGRGGGRRNRLTARWRDPEAADHRPQRQHQTRQGVGLGRGAGFEVNRPPERLVDPGEARVEAGIEHVGRNLVPSPAPVAVGPELVEVDDEGIALLGAGNIEGAGHRIAAGCGLLSVLVPAARIDSGRRYRIAGRNFKHRIVPADIVVVAVGSKIVVGHSAS